MGIQSKDSVRDRRGDDAAPELPPAATDRAPRAQRVRATLRRPLARIPSPLAALLGAVLVFGLAWALLVPPWQKVDEITHFAYVQSLAERGKLPGDGPKPFSTAQMDSQFALNHETVRVNPAAKPEWSRIVYDAWKHYAPYESQKDGGGVSPASGYPPAYYLLASLAYRLGAGGDVLSHLYAVRLVSMLFLLLTTTGVWLLAGELLGRRRPLQLVAAAGVGLWPMVDEISSDVNPDAMLYAVWTFALWLGVKIIRRGLTLRRGLALGACVGLAMVTKATSLALLPAAAFALAYGLWRLRRRALGRAGVAVALAVVVFALPVASWSLVTRSEHRAAYGQATAAVASSPQQGTNWKEFLSYVWEFYLPRLPFQHPVHFENTALATYPAYNVWVATSWAAFGWLDAYFPFWMYPIFLAVTVIVLVAACTKGFLALRRLRGPPRRLPAGVAPTGVFLGLALVVLLAGLHWVEFRNRYPTNHGQYLFPLASYAGIALALAVALVPRRRRLVAAGGVLGALVGYELLCLGLIATRFYGLST